MVCIAPLRLQPIRARAKEPDISNGWAADGLAAQLGGVPTAAPAAPSAGGGAAGRAGKQAPSGGALAAARAAPSAAASPAGGGAAPAGVKRLSAVNFYLIG